mmetsp:Transcript_39146/g.99431  ORF Transcript_39146/g.99431 Transcript_39146/m.99431 type:complete len:217 (-) Transcript_39146:160-810(-)
MIFLPRKSSGMSPSAMRCARPSAIAVLPTPGSPMSTGLFFWRRARIWMVRSSSFARPIIGSISPCSAAFVRSLPYSSSMEVLPDRGRPPPWATTGSFSFSWRSAKISIGTFTTSTSIFCRIFVALPPSSFINARRMWAVSMALEFSFLASSTAATRTSFAAGVNGISTATMPLPRPIISSTTFLVSLRLAPAFLSTLAATPVFSAMTPTSSISVPT